MLEHAPTEGWFINTYFPDRTFLAHLLNGHNLTGTMVEIGVYKGLFAYEFLKVWRGEKYYGIDPWIDNLEGYHELLGGIEEGRTRETDYLTAKNILGEPSERVEFLRDLSSNVHHCFEDNSLDFVYIDGNHDRPYIDEDIRNYLPKVRPGGIFAGHDIFNGEMTSVRDAVYEILHIEMGYEVFVIGGDAWSWYVWKR